MWRYAIEEDRDGKRRWVLSVDGKTVAISPGAFDSTLDARRAAEAFRSGASTWSYDIYTDEHGWFRWRATAPDGSTVASSRDSFSEQPIAERSAADVRANAGEGSGL